jgi:hypothetical protein
MIPHPRLSDRDAALLGLVWLVGGAAVTWALCSLAVELTEQGSIPTFVMLFLTPIATAILAWCIHRSWRLFIWAGIWCGVAQAIGFIILLLMLAAMYFAGGEWHPG